MSMHPRLCKPDEAMAMSASAACVSLWHREHGSGLGQDCSASSRLHHRVHSEAAEPLVAPAYVECRSPQSASQFQGDCCGFRFF